MLVVQYKYLGHLQAKNIPFFSTKTAVRFVSTTSITMWKPSLLLLLCLSTALALPVDEENVKSEDFAKRTASLCTGPNKYPIVFIHGFAGWGPQDGLWNILPYWGMVESFVNNTSNPAANSIIALLNAAGCTAYATTAGPFSSVWDRVAEIYAEIKGTQVDYGAYHSNKWSHTQKPSAYNYANNGLYPQWGTYTCGSGGNQLCKVHLVAHSMGGQDAHVLTSLLHYGNANEIAASGSNVSPLFAGGHDWVDSVTTISTPHDGTTLSSFIEQNIGWIQSLLIDIFALANAFAPGTQQIYDFRLVQFGIEPQQSGESFSTYASRVLGSSLFSLTVGQRADLSVYDLTPDGAYDINTNYPLSPNVYYYSYATDTTYNNGAPCWYWQPQTQAATATTLVLLSLPLAIYPSATSQMGTCFQNGYGYGGFPWECYYYNTCNDNVVSGHNLPPIDSTWFPNDGVVNTRSMNGPSWGLSSAQWVAYTGTNQKGIFQTMTPPNPIPNHIAFSSMDHLAICGGNWLTLTVPSVVPFYNNIANFLSNLPLS